MLESFTLVLLLVKLKTTSPTKLTGVMIMPNMIAADKFMPIKPDKSAKKIGVAIKAPIKPSRVFPGLVFLRRILLPNFFKTFYSFFRRYRMMYISQKFIK